MSNEIQELANDLGVDLGDIGQDLDQDIDKIEKDKQLISDCKAIYKSGCSNDLSWRWDIGLKIREAYDNPALFSEGILKTLSNELDLSISDLSRFKKFSTLFHKEYIEKQAVKGISWSHFKVLVDVKDEFRDYLIKIIDKTSEIKVKDLYDIIHSELDNDSKENNDNSDNKSSSVSPLKHINKSLKLVSNLGDSLTDIFVQIKEGVDFDDDNQSNKYNEKLDELKEELNKLVDIIKQFGGK